MLRILILIVTFLFGSLLTFSQNESAKDSIVAKIKMKKKDNLIIIYGKAINYSKAIKSELKYSMLALKKDENGNLSRVIQTGEFSILIDEEKMLSKQELNINNNEEIKVYLYIRNNTKLISKDSMIISAIDKKYNTQLIDEVNLELSGLIVENTMTKLGKDFYDFFGQINQLNDINYPFIIIINEKPALGGRNSEINIMVNDEIIYRFRTQPKEDYLYSQAKEANRRVYNYHIQKKMLRKKTRVF